MVLNSSPSHVASPSLINTQYPAGEHISGPEVKGIVGRGEDGRQVCQQNQPFNALNYIQQCQKISDFSKELKAALLKRGDITHCKIVHIKTSDGNWGENVFLYAKFKDDISKEEGQKRLSNIKEHAASYILKAIKSGSSQMSDPMRAAIMDSYSSSPPDDSGNEAFPPLPLPPPPPPPPETKPGGTVNACKASDSDSDDDDMPPPPPKVKSKGLSPKGKALDSDSEDDDVPFSSSPASPQNAFRSNREALDSDDDGMPQPSPQDVSQPNSGALQTANLELPDDDSVSFYAHPGTMLEEQHIMGGLSYIHDPEKFKDAGIMGAVTLTGATLPKGKTLTPAQQAQRKEENEQALKRAFDEILASGRKKHYMPLHSGEHWMTLAVQNDGKQITGLTIFNSASSSGHHMDALTCLLPESVLMEGLEKKTVGAELQKTAILSNSCGVFTIAAIRKLVEEEASNKAPDQILEEFKEEFQSLFSEDKKQWDENLRKEAGDSLKAVLGVA